MNKGEVVEEFKLILSLVRNLVDAYSKPKVNVYVDGSNIGIDKMEQNIDFLSEFGLITTKQKEGNKFIIGLNLNILVFYQNYFSEIDYILNGEVDARYYDKCMFLIPRMFKMEKEHCSHCCDYEVQN